MNFLPETNDLRGDAHRIINRALHEALPSKAVRDLLGKLELSDRLTIVAIGKAAWEMAAAAAAELGDKIKQGIVITKYGHAEGEIAHMRIFEAGHPVPDHNSFEATQNAIDMVQPLTDKDTVLFLVSGGGSALFEQPMIDGEELKNITCQLLACGADITEINTIRKRFSRVKGGRFAQLCAPAKVISILLSDVLGDNLSAIASGPTVPDSGTCADALAIVNRYKLNLSAVARKLLTQETPKQLDNVENHVIGSVRQLCASAAACASDMGYETIFLTDDLRCTARDAGSFLGSVARSHANSEKSLAYICGGETVVRLTGKGLGGRNQEIALSAAQSIDGLKDVCVFSVGSDGTDGPTDAAGGYADGDTVANLNRKGINVDDVLSNNDSYHALAECDGLITTGATGTNVNDVSVVLIKR